MTTLLSRLHGLVSIVILVAACGIGASTPAQTPAPTPGAPLTTAQLRSTLIEEFGSLWYCDPDFYPVAQGDEIDAARQRWAEVQADTEAFAAIAARLGIPAVGEVTDEQKLEAYRAWKMLNAIALEQAGDGYRFDYLAQPAAGAAEGRRIAGTISASGEIAIEQEAAAGEPPCPICLVRGTPIDTPTGSISVQRLRTGDLIWTLDSSGRRVVGTVSAIGSTPAPAGHQVVRLELANGRSVTASPGHPLADGRHLGDVAVGDMVDGSVVRSANLVRYLGDETFDLVVSGTTGTYLSDGISLGSTLD